MEDSFKLIGIATLAYYRIQTAATLVNAAPAEGTASSGELRENLPTS